MANSKRTPVTSPKKSEDTSTKTSPPVSKSQRMMSFEEFSKFQDFSKVFKAGFKMYMNGTDYQTEQGWDKSLQEYKNRTI